MSETLTFWFIRHKPTGHVIHQGAGPDKRGGSIVRPQPANNRIRLFTKEWHARAWLTRWVKGPETVRYVRGKEVRRFTPATERRREDMEIVKLEVTLP